MSESQQAGEPLSQRQEQLDRHIATRVDDLLRGLHARIEERVREASDELLHWLQQHAPEIPQSFLDGFDTTKLIERVEVEVPGPAAPAAPSSDLDDLRAAVAKIDAETGQAEILGALLEEGRRFASRTAFFLVRQGRARGWAGRGFEEDRTATVEMGVESAPWSSMLEANAAVALDTEAAGPVAEHLGGPAPDAAVLVPFVIRGQISGALWADRQPDGQLQASALQLLTHAAAMALETAAVSPGLSATLNLHGEVAEASSAGVETQLIEPPTIESAAAADEATGVEVEDSGPVAEPEPAAETEEASPTPDFSVSEGAFEDEPAEPQEPAYEIEAEPAVEPSPEPVVEAEEESWPTEAAEVEEDRDESPSSAPAAAPAEEPPAAEAEAPQVEAPQVEEPQTEVPSDDDIALEAEPEPELEDTNIWELEEDEEDDEPTQVGMARQVSEEGTGGESAVEAEEAAPSTIGQETVRIDLASVQQHPAAQVPPAAPEPAAPEPAAATPADAEIEPDPGDETSPTMHAAPSPAGLAGPAAGRVEEAPSPAAPTSFTEPPPSTYVEPPAPTSFAEPEVEEPAAEAPAPAPVAEAPPPVTSTPEPRAGAEATPAAEEAPEPPAGSTEVAPPPDLDGPGLAFATPAPEAPSPGAGEGDAALHEEARRLARLLVSEIKLYNEEIIEEGRRTGNIYDRLKDDIDRSRQMYEERIDPRLADQEDYFYQELVQRLAGGDESLLKM